MGMILTADGTISVDLSCPHTHGDDPDDALFTAPVTFLSPHAWG